MTDKPPPEPVDRHAMRRKAREQRLAAALRANLKRRKAAARPPGQGEGPAGISEGTGSGGKGSGKG